MTCFPEFDYYGLTDQGLVRTENEDQFLIAELSRALLVHQTSLDLPPESCLRDRHPAYLFLVADGLGGAPEGARASSLAVDSIMRSVLGVMPWFYRFEGRQGDIEQELKKVLDKCELMIQADVAENPSLRGMGTTLTMAYLLWPTLFVVHVGDTRAYLLRGKELLQITHDHTVDTARSGSQLIEAYSRKELWNVIGGENTEVWPEIYKVELTDGDAILLSTDGLSRHVSSQAAQAILARSETAKAACEQLVSAANEEGGVDNTTVIVVRFGRRKVNPPPTSIAAAASSNDEESSGETDSQVEEDLEEV